LLFFAYLSISDYMQPQSMLTPKLSSSKERDWSHAVFPVLKYQDMRKKKETLRISSRVSEGR